MSVANITGIVLPKGPISTATDIIENILPSKLPETPFEHIIKNLPLPPNPFKTQSVDEIPTYVDATEYSVETYIPVDVATLEPTVAGGEVVKETKDGSKKENDKKSKTNYTQNAYITF